MKPLLTGLVVSGFLLLAGACSSSNDGGSGSCPNVQGTWQLSGNCSDSQCIVSQSGCNISLDCSPTGTTYSGSVSGSGISFSEANSGSCSGSVNGKSAVGSCSSSAGTCDWTASCTSGSCGSTGGGGGGSGGGSSVDCNSSCKIVTACCTGMPIADCLEGCSQNSSSQACLACLDNPSCGALAPCLIANCNVPASLCPGSL